MISILFMKKLSPKKRFTPAQALTLTVRLLTVCEGIIRTQQASTACLSLESSMNKFTQLMIQDDFLGEKN